MEVGESVAVVEVELEVVEVDEEEVLVDKEEVVVELTKLRGICAKIVAIGFILNMSAAVLQHAKLPTPFLPVSQQLLGSAFPHSNSEE